MIIKWGKGELRRKADSPHEEGSVEYSWHAGYVEFGDHWFRVIKGTQEMSFRYDLVRQVNFHDRVNVEWLTNGYARMFTPKAKAIYNELMNRLRTLFAEGKGAGQLVGKVS